jgi:hypothetical protein
MCGAMQSNNTHLTAFVHNEAEIQNYLHMFLIILIRITITIITAQFSFLKQFQAKTIVVTNVSQWFMKTHYANSALINTLYDIYV